MEVNGQNTLRFGLIYYDNNGTIQYNLSNDKYDIQNGWQFVNVTEINENEEQYTTMLVTLDDEYINLYNLQIKNNTGDTIQYQIQKPNGKNILTGDQSFNSRFLALQDENIIYFYTIQIVDGVPQCTELNQNTHFDLLDVYEMFNVTNDYIKPSKVMQIHRTILYNQDILILQSQYSEYDEETDNMIAFYRILDNDLEYFWSGCQQAQLIKSNNLGTLILQGNFGRGSQNTAEVNMDGLINDYNMNITNQILSCYFIEEIIETEIPINNPNSDQIVLKLKNGLNLDTIEEDYQCTLDKQVISYVDYYQNIVLSYDNETLEYRGKVDLKSSQLSCEFQVSNYPYSLNNKLTSYYILVIQNSIQLESCYKSAKFTADISNNKVTFTAPNNYTVGTCQIDKPSINAILEYQGKNYTKQMTYSSKPSIQQLSSFEALFEPNLYPSFQSENLPLYLIINSYSPSGIQIAQNTVNYTLDQDLDTCFTNQQKTWLLYYDDALHVRSINQLQSKYDQPCQSIFNDYDLFQVTLYDKDRQNSQLLDTNTWSEYKLKFNKQQNHYSKILKQFRGFTNDMAHYSQINFNKEKLAVTADFLFSIDDSDQEKVHQYNLKILQFLLLPCIVVPDSLKIYQYDSYTYLDTSGNRNCNASGPIDMDSITLLTESEECTFTSQISDNLFQSKCSYYKNALLKYEFTLEFTWNEYEIDEDITMYTEVNNLDKTKKNTLWELNVSLIVLIVCATYIGTGFRYWWKNIYLPKKNGTYMDQSGIQMQETQHEDNQKANDEQKDIINLDYDKDNQQDDGDILQQNSSMTDSQDDEYMYDTIPMPKYK